MLHVVCDVTFLCPFVEFRVNSMTCALGPLCLLWGASRMGVPGFKIVRNVVADGVCSQINHRKNT